MATSGAGGRSVRVRRAAGGPRRRLGSPRLWLLGLCVAAVPAAVLATVVLPGAAGLSGRWPWNGLIAFRGILAAITLVAAVPAGLLVALFRHQRRTRTVFAALALTGLAATLGQVVVLGVRGYFPVHPAGAAPVDGLTVVVTNTDHSAADPAGLTSLYLAVGADVVSMPEGDTNLAAEVAQRLAAAGHPVQVFSVAGQGRITPTALLVSDRLGVYRQANADGNNIGEIMAVPVGGVAGRPTLIAVHPQAPVGPTLSTVWATDTHQAIGLCRDSADAVLAGDFNSTVDHPALRDLGSCADAAQTVGAAGVATWPQSFPRFFGAPLDHVFATTARWHPVAAWVEPILGSDHRALVTRLLPVGPGVDVATWHAG